MKKEQITTPEIMAMMGFTLAEMILNTLVTKNLIPLEEAKDLLLGFSARMDAESTKAKESGSPFEAASYRAVKDFVMAAVERLDSRHYPRQPG